MKPILRRILGHGLQLAAVPLALGSTYGLWSGMSHQHPGAQRAWAVLATTALILLYVGGWLVRRSGGTSSPAPRAQRKP